MRQKTARGVAKVRAGKKGRVTAAALSPELAAEGGSVVAALVVRAVVAVVFAFALVVAGLSMLEVPLQPMPLVAAALVAVALAIASHWERGLRGALIVCGIIAVLLIVFRPGPLFDGLPLVLNQAFQASAAHQNYVYEMLAVGLPEGEIAGHMSIGLTFFAACLAALVSWGVIGHRPVVIIALLAAVLCLQVYLGIAPAFAPMLFACVTACVALAVSGLSKSALPASAARPAAFAAAALLLCTCVVAGVTFVAYPSAYHESNPAIDAINENGRDGVAGAETVFEAFTNSLTGQDSQQGASQAAADGTQETEQADTADVAQAVGAKRTAPMPLWVIALLVLLAVIVALAIAYLVKRHLVRRRFSEGDARSTSHAIFRYAVRCLELAGVRFGNEGYRDVSARVGEGLGDEYASHYDSLVCAWQELRYTTGEVDSARKEAVSAEAAWLRQHLSEKLSLPARLKVAALSYTKN